MVITRHTRKRMNVSLYQYFCYLQISILIYEDRDFVRFYYLQPADIQYHYYADELNISTSLLARHLTYSGLTQESLERAIIMQSASSL
jgi:hypothetical protein